MGACFLIQIRAAAGLGTVLGVAAVEVALLGIADGARRIRVGVILTTEDMHQNDGQDRGQREPDGPVEAGRDDQRGLRQDGSGLCLRFGLWLLRGDRGRGGLAAGAADRKVSEESICSTSANWASSVVPSNSNQ